VPDHLVRGLFAQHGLRAVFARLTDTARIARMLHGCYPTSAILMAESLTAGVLLGALLEKDEARVNLQIECDGPLRGLLIDADAKGNVRGWVRSPQVHFLGDPEQGTRAALGRSGFLSVMRDFGAGNIYRGAVELEEYQISGDLRRYFRESEQIATALDIQVLTRPDEPIVEAAGLVVQRLPDGDEAMLDEIRERLASGVLRQALADGASAQETIRRAAGEGFDLLADVEIAFRCKCSQARARSAVSALGEEGIADVLSKEKKAVITCEFCRQVYVVTEAELIDIARRLGEQTGE
jgi:molecular chaperone Hsp33